MPFLFKNSTKLSKVPFNPKFLATGLHTICLYTLEMHLTFSLFTFYAVSISILGKLWIW